MVAIGDYSIKGCSTSKSTSNTLENIITGTGAGPDGPINFQESVLDILEQIIKNRLSIDYQRASVENSPTQLNLFFDNTNIQSPAPSATLLKDYLLKVDAYTETVTIPITDATTVAFVTYLANQTFSAIRNGSRFIDTSLVSDEICPDGSTGRFLTCTETCAFSLQIIIQ